MTDNAMAAINMTKFDMLSHELYSETWEKKMEGGSYQGGMEIERLLYYSVARNKCIKTICEIGFNTGHSALLWLLANPTATIVEFDLFRYPYNFLGEKFLFDHHELNASRMSIHKGDSKIEVNAFFQKNPNFKCDLLSVDGSHDYGDALEDVSNMMKLANPEWNVLLVDDTNCNSSFCVDAVIAEHVRRGNVEVVKAISLMKGTRGITLLHYLRDAIHNSTLSHVKNGEGGAI